VYDLCLLGSEGQPEWVYLRSGGNIVLCFFFLVTMSRLKGISPYYNGVPGLISLWSLVRCFCLLWRFTYIYYIHNTVSHYVYVYLYTYIGAG